MTFVAIQPRLLNERAAAQYLGVSLWTIHDYLASGRLVAVELPGLTPRKGDRAKPVLRRRLVDRHDLDRLVENRKRIATMGAGPKRPENGEVN